MNDLYKTIESASEGLYKEKGSKFIAMTFPVKSLDEINGQIAVIRKQYHDASHHCYAWRLGADGDRYRANDDGEPSGSAGKPIYGQILSRDLSDVLIVVIRYFGGTLLGVGGLINAYRSAASNALEKSRIIEKKVYGKLLVEFEYAQMNSVMGTVKNFQLIIDSQHFDLSCSLKVKVWKRMEKEVIDRFTKIDGCKISEDQ